MSEDWKLLLSGFLPRCFIDPTIVFPCPWEMGYHVAEKDAATQLGEAKGLHFCVLIPKRSFVGGTRRSTKKIFLGFCDVSSSSQVSH